MKSQCLTFAMIKRVQLNTIIKSTKWQWESVTEVRGQVRRAEVGR